MVTEPAKEVHTDLLASEDTRQVNEPGTGLCFCFIRCIFFMGLLGTRLRPPQKLIFQQKWVFW